MKGKNVIAFFLVSILVAIKCYIVLYSWPINDGPYQKVNRSDLEIEIDENGYSLIIDQKIILCYPMSMTLIDSNIYMSQFQYNQ